MSLININSEQKKTIPWKLLIIFLFFSAAIILMGTFYYILQRDRVFKEQQNNLSVIASLKVAQIIRWHKETLGNAAVIRDNEPLINRFKLFLVNDGQPGIREELTKWMKSLNTEYDYSEVLLVDTLLNIRLSSSLSDSIINEDIRSEISEAIRDQVVIMTDLRRYGKTKSVYMDLLIPLIDPGNKKQKTLGVIVLRIDPDLVLFPLIQSWPTSSKSSETLILRKDNDSVLYLNELRHKKNTALNLRLPLIDKDLLAAKAVMGLEGLVEGTDYRNIPVVGFLTRIPDLHWYMVAKVDKKEILLPLKKYVFLILIVVVLLILINASVFGFWIWEQQVRLYRSQLKNERALRESEEKFATVFQMSPVSISLSSLADNKFIDVNNTFLNDTEYTRNEVIGHTALELKIWANEAERQWTLNEISEKGEFFGKGISFRSKTGKMIYGLVSMSVVKVNGQPFNLSTIVNITAWKNAEEALRESEDKFKYVFDHSVIGKSITLPSGEIHVNMAFCDMLGYAQEELEKTKWQLISHPDDIEMTQRNLNLLLTGEKDSVRFIKRYIHKNGLVVWADVGTALRRDKEGNPLYFMTAINNITDRKNAESQIKKLNEELEQRVNLRTEQLEAANKELEAFSYSVSHDLRAPLRSVHGFTKILLEDYEAKLDEEGKRICGIISSSATQMGELIDDLLSFSRIGRSKMNPSLIDMIKMTRLVFEGMTSSSERGRINLKIGELHQVFGDVTLLGQVWINLISNAIKYTSKEITSEILIGSQLEGDVIRYFIKDNGVGFDMQYAHKLYGVFQRLHGESEFEGNGVGLAIVQRIILKHGGKVWAEAEVGKGATFYFSLPADGVSSS